MKKYMICLSLFLTVSAVCVAAGYAASHYQREYDTSAATSETVTEADDSGQEAANQELVQHQLDSASEYYLVSENGFLMVFKKDQESVCLYTHIPIMEMPASEQDRLREGIWFPNMTELFQYLESCTS